MAAASTIIGIDLGGTKTAVALFDAQSMKQLTIKVIPTDAKRGFKAVLAMLLAEIAAIRTESTVAIGLGVPGFIDTNTGTIVTMPNIPGAEGMELAACIQYETHLPTVVENDARCFAYAEALIGAGKDHSVVLGIALGTGVGGGIVVDKKIFHGSRGYAGEIGHLLLVPGQPPYETKDKRGDVEQFLSGTAMGRRCEAAKRPQDYLEGEVCGFMQPHVLREVAWLVVDVMHVLDPSIVILGGSAGRALKPHLPAIRKELGAWLVKGITPPELVCGSITDAAVKGAGLLAASMIKKN